MVKIDHDPHNSRRLALREVIRRAERANLLIFRMWERRSPSGRGWHRMLWVTPEPTSAAQIVALQLLFGSDPLRESYNYNRSRIVDAGIAPEYWRAQDSWDVLYVSADKWREVTAKMLTAHRERNGKARTRTPRAI